MSENEKPKRERLTVGTILLWALLVALLWVLCQVLPLAGVIGI